MKNTHYGFKCFNTWNYVIRFDIDLQNFVLVLSKMYLVALFVCRFVTGDAPNIMLD